MLGFKQRHHQYVTGGFFEKYEDLIMPEPNTGCWIWLGSRTSAGYGNLNDPDDGYTYAHHKAFKASGRRMEKGTVIRHRCDLRCCVNPDHLIRGTYLDNFNDSVERGRMRWVKGSESGNAKLNEDAVRDIRRRRAIGELAKDIAAQYGVNPSIISNIMAGRIWKHVK